MVPLNVAVAGLVKQYLPKMTPAPLIKALEGLVESHVEARDRRETKELAAAVCRKLHPEPASHVACGGCFDAALERINGE
jgi:hypothetical protein